MPSDPAGNLDAYDTVEIWTEGREEWSEGPKLPVGVKGTKGISTFDNTRFIVAGGYNYMEGGYMPYLQELTCTNINNCKWNTWAKALDTARRNFGITLLPHNMASCNSVNVMTKSKTHITILAVNDMTYLIKLSSDNQFCRIFFGL